MLAEVRKCIESNDIKGLHYVFVDCLDVDPTFEKYEEDYEYCKSISGFLEEYIEITPLINDKTKWDGQYWQKLKSDLMKNFSNRRFIHMKKVAKIIYKDKVTRLLEERNKPEHNEQIVISNKEKNTIEKPTVIQKEEVRDTGETFISDHDKKTNEEEKINLPLHNKKNEKKQEEQKRKIAEANAESMRQQNGRGKLNLKKVVGIAVVFIVIIVAIIALIKMCNPH